MKVLKVISHRIINIGVEFKIEVQRGIFFKKQSIEYIVINNDKSFYSITGEFFSLTTQGFPEAMNRYEYSRNNQPF